MNVDLHWPNLNPNQSNEKLNLSSLGQAFFKKSNLPLIDRRIWPKYKMLIMKGREKLSIVFSLITEVLTSTVKTKVIDLRHRLAARGNNRYKIS